MAHFTITQISAQSCNPKERGLGSWTLSLQISLFDDWRGPFFWVNLKLPLDFTVAVTSVLILSAETSLCLWYWKSLWKLLRTVDPSLSTFYGVYLQSRRASFPHTLTELSSSYKYKGARNRIKYPAAPFSFFEILVDCTGNFKRNVDPSISTFYFGRRQEVNGSCLASSFFHLEAAMASEAIGIWTWILHSPCRPKSIGPLPSCYEVYLQSLGASFPHTLTELSSSFIKEHETELNLLQHHIFLFRNVPTLIPHISCLHLTFSSRESTSSLYNISDGTALLDLSEDAYRRRLTQFLFSSAGAKFRLLFRFEEEPSCTDPAPDMLVRYRGFDISRIDEYCVLMHNVGLSQLSQGLSKTKWVKMGPVAWVLLLRQPHATPTLFRKEKLNCFHPGESWI